MGLKPVHKKGRQGEPDCARESSKSLGATKRVNWAVKGKGKSTRWFFRAEGEQNKPCSEEKKEDKKGCANACTRNNEKDIAERFP